MLQIHKQQRRQHRVLRELLLLPNRRKKCDLRKMQAFVLQTHMRTVCRSTICLQFRRLAKSFVACMNSSSSSSFDMEFLLKKCTHIENIEDYCNKRPQYHLGVFVARLLHIFHRFNCIRVFFFSFFHLRYILSYSVRVWTVWLVIDDCNLTEQSARHLFLPLSLFPFSIAAKQSTHTPEIMCSSHAQLLPIQCRAS